MGRRARVLERVYLPPMGHDSALPRGSGSSSAAGRFKRLQASVRVARGPVNPGRRSHRGAGSVQVATRSALRPSAPGRVLREVAVERDGHGGARIIKARRRDPDTC